MTAALADGSAARTAVRRPRRPSTIGPAAFRSTTSPTCAPAGLMGLMVPERLGGLGAGFADYADVAYELARGNGATALVFNMHASVTGALAGIPGGDGRHARHTAGVLRRPRRDPARRRGWRVLRRRDERARRRLAAVRDHHVVRARGRRVPDQGREDVRLRCRPRRRLPGRRARRRRPAGGLAVPGAGDAPRAARSRRPGTRWACAPPARTTCTSTSW